MTKTFTHDDVLRYLYEETTPEETGLIEESLTADPELLLFYLDMAELKIQLNRTEFGPSDQTVEAILAYSRNHPKPNPAPSVLYH
jgi:hypothetical protein